MCNYTGIGISCGGGLCNVAMAYLSAPIVTFSVAKAGDYIDARAASVTGERANRIRLGATYFHQRFTNLIACCVFLAVPPFVTTGNIGRARANGLEVTSEVDLLDTLVASVNYTYTETKNLVTGAWLPREPQHRWNARLASRATIPRSG